VNKKLSLNGNAVVPVLFFNTLVCSIIFIPFVVLSTWFPETLSGTLFYVPRIPLEVHGYIMLKAVIVLASWHFAYFATKHLPLTLTGPIKASQPVMTLMGALLIFQERLNLYQWIGVILALISFYMLSSSGKKEGIHFTHNKWILCMVLSAVTGSMSGLYDKFLMSFIEPMAVQAWYNFYQCILMVFVLVFLWYPTHKKTTPFSWRWSIVLISVFLTIADFVYFYALSFPDSMISIVSMIRRSNVLVTFAAGALFFHEKNLKNKAVDLFFVLLGMIFLYLGSK
jgi:transporter family protein